MMIPLWYGLFMGLAAAYFGFWYGRSRNWGLLEPGKESGSEEREKGEKNGNSRREGGVKALPPHVRFLASPAGGRIERIPQEQGVGVRIETTESRLYSPSSGRVLSIAPRGNAFLIMTDWGSEVEVRACSSEDDLLDRYFRPRVIRGEIVRRGKLLLEYDREKLSGECEDTAVYLLAKGEDAGELELVEAERVRSGEALFWVG